MRRELDVDEISDLIRRTPGIDERDRKIVRLYICNDMAAADIAEEDGIYCDRSTVNRHLKKVIPIVELRREMDKRKACGE